MTVLYFSIISCVWNVFILFHHHSGKYRHIIHSLFLRACFVLLSHPQVFDLFTFTCIHLLVFPTLASVHILEYWFLVIGKRNSCRHIFTTLKILPLSSLYIYSLLCFVVDNMDQYYFVSDVQNRDTRQVFNLNLYQPSTHLSIYFINIPERHILHGH
jgi:hypothetical protein